MALLYNNLGFYKIPITKTLLGGVLLTSCALHVPILANYRQFIICNITDVIFKYKFWRILLSKLAFYDLKDLVCGSLLLYYFRVFERRFGSHKYASYLLVTFTVSTILEVSMVSLLNYLNVLNIEYLVCGPFNLIYPLFINYYLDIPRVTQTHILGIPITAKSLTYLLGLQTMITSNSSIVCAISGLISGLICRSNLLYICDFIKVPKSVSSLANKLFGWLLESNPPQEGPIQMGATLEIQRQQHIELVEQQMLFARYREINQRNDLNIFPIRRPNESNTTQPSIASAVTNSMAQSSAPNEEHVTTLVEMGFDRQNVVRALQRSNNDVNLATNLLLSES